MSHRNRTRSRRVAGLFAIAALSSIAMTNTVHAGQGPICEDNEEPVCEEPPPPPPSPRSHAHGFITIIDDPLVFQGVTFRLVLV